MALVEAFINLQYNKSFGISHPHYTIRIPAVINSRKGGGRPG